MAEALAASRGVRCLVVRRGEGAAWTRRGAPPGDGDVLVEPLAVGLDGTDEAVAQGEEVEPPPGRDDLVLGHEALLRVVDDGTRAVPLVRRGCGACRPCRRGASDLCETGRYREHGIRGLDGWFADRALARPEELVPVPDALGLEAVLTEPLSIGAKALQHARAVRLARTGEDFGDARALVVGLGSLGSTACLLLRDAGFDLTVLDRSPTPESRRFAGLVGAQLREAPPEPGDAFDLVLETPGAMPAIAAALRALAPNGVLVTLGTPSGARRQDVPAARLVRELVLENQSVLGSVNSNRAHVEEALQVLARWRGREPGALELLLASRFAPEQGPQALLADAPLKKVVVWDGSGFDAAPARAPLPDR